MITERHIQQAVENLKRNNGIGNTFTIANIITIICFTFASGFIIGWVANWVVQHWNVLCPW